MAATFAHTPGPWQVRDNRVEFGSDGYTVAVVTKGCPEFEGNARLIAAAPELLAALERLLGIAWSVGSLAWDDAVAQARLALARAKGGAA
jgi:hypothetical protein